MVYYHRTIKYDGVPPELIHSIPKYINYGNKNYLARFRRFHQICSEFTRFLSSNYRFILSTRCFLPLNLGLPVPHEIDEYKFIDAGIQGMALEFLQAYIIKHSAFKNLTFTIGVLDSMIKNLICYFPEKVSDI